MEKSSSIHTRLKKIILPREAEQVKSGLQYWRFEFFYRLCVIYLLGILLSGSTAMIVYVVTRQWQLVPILLAANLLFVFIIFWNRFDFTLRRVCVILVFYLFGFSFMLVEGMCGLGLTFFMACPLIASVIFGFKQALYSLSVNMLILVAVNVGFHFLPQPQAVFTHYSPIFLGLISITFVLVNVVIVLPINTLFTHLDEALNQETFIRQSLEEEMLRRIDLERELTAEKSSLQGRVEERTAQLQAANAEMQELMKYKDIFFASVSHELRTPIHAISGYSHLLQKTGEGQFSPRQNTYIERINESSDHLLKVVNDILDITRISAGKLEVNPEWVPLRETCESAAGYIRPEALKKNIQLNIIIDDDIQGISADPQRFKQIVINLLGNAVKFTPENGLAGITARRGAEQIEIEFWDTGIGIYEAEHERVFSPFYRSSNAHAEDVQGTGLGLALVKNLVDAHGWEIWFESKLNEGTSFTIRIPQNAHRG